MKIRKEVLYITAIVLIILLIIVAFRDKINFSPAGDGDESATERMWLENAGNLGASIAEGEEAGEIFISKLRAAVEGIR